MQGYYFQKIICFFRVFCICFTFVLHNVVNRFFIVKLIVICCCSRLSCQPFQNHFWTKKVRKKVSWISYKYFRFFRRKVAFPLFCLTLIIHNHFLSQKKLAFGRWLNNNPRERCFGNDKIFIE